MADGDSQEQGEGRQEDGDLGDMLQEMRILLQGAQVLTAFLIILPFNQGFRDINEAEKWVFVATFFCSITSMVLFTAPAAHHRLVRPLMQRERFKTFATRVLVAGLVPLSFALTLSSYLVVAEAIGRTTAVIGAILVGLLIVVVWWVMALTRKQET